MVRMKSSKSIALFEWNEIIKITRNYGYYYFFRLFCAAVKEDVKKQYDSKSVTLNAQQPTEEEVEVEEMRKSKA